MKESTLTLISHVSALIVAFTVAVHFMNQAFLDTSSYREALTYEVVLTRYQAPIAAILLFLLLGAALTHGLIGLRTVLLELSPKTSWERLVNVFVVALGAVLFVYGSRTFYVTIVQGAAP